MSTPLPRPPRRGRTGTLDSFELHKWFDEIWRILKGAAAFAWTSIDFTGSKLDDILTRPHSMLQTILQADENLSDTNPAKHVTNLQAYDWAKNRTAVRAATADTLAVEGEFLSVTCSTVNITVTLPNPVASPGYPLWIRKTDATAFEVQTSVKNIKFQNSTMKLVSDGTNWVIS
jgi:hypothetical protein